MFFITLGIVAKSYWFKWKSFPLKFNKEIVIKLGHYSLMAIVSAVTVPAGQIIVRNFITSQSSITDAGLWKASTEFQECI